MFANTMKNNACKLFEKLITKTSEKYNWIGLTEKEAIIQTKIAFYDSINVYFANNLEFAPTNTNNITFTLTDKLTSSYKITISVNNIFNAISSHINKILKLYNWTGMTYNDAKQRIDNLFYNTMNYHCDIVYEDSDDEYWGGSDVDISNMICIELCNGKIVKCYYSGWIPLYVQR